MKKIISASIASVLILALSVGAFAFDCDVFSAGAVEGFSEDAENKTDTFVQFLEDDNGDFVDNYNVYYLENNTYNLTAEEMLKKSGGEEKLAKDYADYLLKGFEEQGYTAEVKSISAKLYNMNGFDGILITCNYILNDSECFLSQISVPREKATVYVSATTDNAESAEKLLEDASKLLAIHADEAEGSTLVGRLTVALVIIGALVGGAVAINKSKKKKQIS